MLARELAMERMRRAGAANMHSELTARGGAEAGALMLPATGAARKGGSTPMFDSFMAARLAPTAAPLNLTVEKKVTDVLHFKLVFFCEFPG